LSVYHNYIMIILYGYMFRLFKKSSSGLVAIYDYHNKYVWLKVQLVAHGFMCILYSSIFFALHVSGAICTHPQEHKLQSTAIGVCNVYGIFIHWSRYWLGHLHTVRVSQPSHVASFRGHDNRPHGTGHSPHTPLTQNIAWLAYQALTTPWGWQPYGETCRGKKIWNVLIKIHYFFEHLLVFLQMLYCLTWKES
jgi:hypothetical protein